MSRTSLHDDLPEHASLSLADHGGQRAVNFNVPHYVWPHLGPEQVETVVAQLRHSISDRDARGVIGEFERAFATFVGRKHAIAFSSGTSAIHAMCVSAGLGAGDDILCPAYMFPATASPFVYESVRAVLCDCDSLGNVTAQTLESKLTGRTKAVIVSHMWGNPCDMTDIVQLCTEKGLWLLEDCSHAHFASFRGQRVGTFGDMAAYSLNQKAITAGEGGVFVTDRDDLRDRALLFGHYNKRCHQELSPLSPQRSLASTGYGLKLRAHPLGMALALDQLRRAADIECRRRRNHDTLSAALSEDGPLRPLSGSPEARIGLYVFPFRYRSLPDLPPRAEVLRLLHVEGATEVDVPESTCPVGEMPLFAAAPRARDAVLIAPSRCGRPIFEGAERFHAEVLKCPLWGYAGDDEVVSMYARALHKVARFLIRISSATV